MSEVRETNYLYGLDEVAQSVAALNPQTNQWTEANHFFAHDAHGSVRQLFQPSGRLAQGMDYDAYGQTLIAYDQNGAPFNLTEESTLTGMLYNG